MPRAARGVSTPQRVSIFFHYNVSNLFLHRYDVPAATTEYELSSALNRRKFAISNWHSRNSEQRRFLNVGGGTNGWMYCSGFAVLF